MELTFAPRGILQIDDARIIHRNFEGRREKYNNEGDRNFSVVIPNRDMADALISEGWNVKIRESSDGYDEPFMFLKVKVSYRYQGPRVYLISGKKMVELDKESIKMLDNIDIDSVDMDISPSKWIDDDGNPRKSAYLDSIHVVQKLDRFATRYSDVDDLAE